ncbi:hypothetical protein [uncultured Alcanivorax sp.]|uniref:hypothetical protein n=1 Tax=uncultured Alcanivorax sp. TaxID=191215 RepID=UPI0032B2C808
MEKVEQVLRSVPHHLAEPSEILHWLYERAVLQTEFTHEEMALQVHLVHHRDGKRRSIDLPKDARACYRKLGRYLAPESATNLPLDVAQSVIKALPEPYGLAARVLLFPSQVPMDAVEGSTLTLLEAERMLDAQLDSAFFRIGSKGVESFSKAELLAHAEKITEYRNALERVEMSLRKHADESKRGAA